MAKRQNTTIAPALHVIDDANLPEVDTLEITDTEPLEVYAPLPRDWTPLITGSVVGITAIGLALVALTANISFTASFGSGFTAVVFTVLAAIIELLALALPPLGTVLASKGDRRGAYTAWLLWVPCCAMVLLSSCGFSSKFLTDATFGRGQIVDFSQGRKTELANLKTQREAIKELRSVAELDAVLSAKGSRKTHQDAIIARAEATNRDSLDAKISALETQIASAPAVAMADPAANVGSQLLSSLTMGLISPSEHGIALLRTLILTALPATAGLLLSLALRVVPSPFAD
jgi:hypothetical protein